MDGGQERRRTSRNAAPKGVPLGLAPVIRHCNNRHKEGMKQVFLLVSFMFSFLLAVNAPAQNLSLPEGAQTKWVVDGPEEIVSYLVFDPLTVKEKIPSFLRFITINELAVEQIPWAKEHLSKYPAHADWGISFLEIVKMKTFDIDGRRPKWPENGAMALWFARVAQSDSTNELGQGKPFLALEFWMPDSMYVSYMRNKGHYASYGDVRLHKNSEGKWMGAIDVAGLSVVCECMPSRSVEGFGSNGMQVIIPPAKSGVMSIVRVAFAGHQEQLCEEDATWKFKGVHPLVNGMILGPSSFQFGYSLIGGAYLR